MQQPLRNAQQYLQQQIAQASPAQQIVMLFDGAIKFTSRAKEAIAAGDIQERHNNNRRAMEILAYMMDLLDLDKGGDVAKRLYSIYSFLLRRLVEVDFRNDPRICDEVMEHLRSLRGNWELVARQEVGRKASPQPLETANGIPFNLTAVA